MPNNRCGGQWKLPRNCDTAKGNCEYSASWEYLGAKRGKDGIKFTIQTTDIDRWIGIGFSDDLKMVNIQLYFYFLL